MTTDSHAALAAEVVALRQALIDVAAWHTDDETDACWCNPRLAGAPHRPYCQRARKLLGMQDAPPAC